MQFHIAYYALHAKRSTLRAKAPPRRATQRALRDYRLVLRCREGGCGSPSAEVYRARAKILLLLRLKQLYSQDSFIRDAPLTVAFFDEWFEIEELGQEVAIDVVLGNLTPDLFDHPNKGPEAAEIEATWLHRQSEPKAESELRYRISVGGGFAGWIEAPVWQGGEIRGQWESMITLKGKEFASACVPGEGYDAIVEVWNTALRGRLIVSENGEATLCITQMYSTLIE